MAFSSFSSSARKEDMAAGSVIWIWASNSVFLISRAQENRAILAFSTWVGILAWTFSLSTTIPWTR